eukprot:scaffold44050_cov380-Skeletonema_marinoi.AAC.3
MPLGFLPFVRLNLFHDKKDGFPRQDDESRVHVRRVVGCCLSEIAWCRCRQEVVAEEDIN